MNGINKNRRGTLENFCYIYQQVKHQYLHINVEREGEGIIETWEERGSVRNGRQCLVSTTPVINGDRGVDLEGCGRAEEETYVRDRTHGFRVRGHAWNG